MKQSNPIPPTSDDWLQEIALAYKDASDTKPFGPLVGQSINDADLFHLAPAICLKFRGIKQTNKILKRVTETALSSYVATQDNADGIFEVPVMAFAFCYVASHFGLALIDEELSTELLDYIENNLERLSELISSVD